jgi:hypothetical protein
VNRRLLFVSATSLCAIAALIACGDDSRESAFASGSGDSGADGPNGFEPGDDAAVVGAASGVVLLHAAAFLPFRLCFENYPNLVPQPDTSVMPEANVVGVEIGSVVRIGAMPVPPGKIFVFDQRKVRATPGDPNARTCGDLLADTGAFVKNLDYLVAGSVDDPLGVDQVDVLAITGCGAGAFLDLLGVDPASCTGWDPVAGSLRAQTVSLFPTIQATSKSLPVQIVHMSSLLEATRGPEQRIDVTFGAFDGGMNDNVDVPPLFEAGAPKTLRVDQDTQSVFGSHGFRITLGQANDAGTNDGGALVVDQSLADIQELSFPQTVPRTYYGSASNYALLLLGDPNITRTFVDGGRNPSFDARRALHFLAIPVQDKTLDAGALPTDSDAAARSRSDGG